MIGLRPQSLTKIKAQSVTILRAQSLTRFSAQSELRGQCVTRVVRPRVRIQFDIRVQSMD